MAAEELLPLRDGPKGRVPEVRNAYRFLRGAHKTVADLFTVLEAESEIRRSGNSDMRGRMATWEVDLLRSAIVFTSSGLDASMTRLVFDIGRYLVPRPGTGARAQYERFVRDALAGTNPVDQGLRDAIISPDPAAALLDYYLRARTKASFQGSGDLGSRVRNCLGIPKTRVPDSSLAALDPFFKARNRIVHDMDYEAPDSPKRLARIHRSREAAGAMCNSTFEVAADLMHAAADVVLATSQKPSP